MRSTKTRIAFVCYAVATLGLAAAGARYVSAPQIMYYHEQATGAPWADLAPGVQTMLLGFMKGDGVGMLATALAMALLLLIPFRRGERWARWGIAAVGLAWFLPTLYLAWTLAGATGAATPWPPVLFVVVLLALGLLLSGDVGERPADG
jgi:hypothetical protein